MSLEEIFSSVFHDAVEKIHTDDYPDIFKNLFLELIEKSTENQYSLKLLLIVACKATLQQKMHQLKVLLCAPEEAESEADLESIDRSRTQ